jgi:nitroreductase
MDFDEVVASRHSVRDFDGEPVPDDVIRQIVEEAGKAPSWGNTQPWRVYVATGAAMDEIRQEHEKAVVAGTKGASDFGTIHRTQWGQQAQSNMAAFGDQIRRELGEDSKMSEDNSRLFNVGTVLYLTVQKTLTNWNILDLGAFEQTLALAAKNRGYDTIIAYEFVRLPQIARKVLGIPSDEVLAIGLGIGHATDAQINSLRSDRMPVDRYLTIHHDPVSGPVNRH